MMSNPLPYGKMVGSVDVVFRYLGKICLCFIKWCRPPSERASERAWKRAPDIYIESSLPRNVYSF